jgi:uncharacterized UBP type Zn finger protein
MSQPLCEHFELLGKFDVPTTPQCDECVKINARWVHLRTCQSCGVTLCCDSSPNKHMTKHYEATKHALVISAEPNEQWAYCYAHDQMESYS